MSTIIVIAALNTILNQHESTDSQQLPNAPDYTQIPQGLESVDTDLIEC